MSLIAVDNQTGKLAAAVLSTDLSINLGGPWTGPSVAAPDWARLVLDPSLLGVPNSLFEVAYVNVTNGSSVATVTPLGGGTGRGMERTTAVGHAKNALWDCGGTAFDLNTPPWQLAHLHSLGPGPPTLTNVSTSIASYSLGPGSTDTRGTINVVISVVGTVNPGGGFLTLVFNQPYADADYAVVLSGDTQGNGVGVDFSPFNKLATGFEVWHSGSSPMTAGLAYSFDYFVIE